MIADFSEEVSTRDAIQDFYITDNAGKRIRKRDISYDEMEYYFYSSVYPHYVCCTNYAAGLKAGREAAIKASTAWTEGYSWGQLIANRELNSATDAIRDRYVTNSGTDAYASTSGWIYGLQPYFEWLDLNHSDCTIWREAIQTGYTDYMKVNDPDRFKDPTTVDTIDTSSFAYTTGYNLASSTSNYPYFCWYYNSATSTDDMQTDGTSNHYYQGYFATLIDWAETNHPECTAYIAGMKAAYEEIKASAYYKACINHYHSLKACDITGRPFGEDFEEYGADLSAITDWTNEISHYTMNTLLIKGYDESTDTLSFAIYTVNSSSDIINERAVAYFTNIRTFYLQYMRSSYIPIIALIDCQGPYFHGRYLIAYMLANGKGNYYLVADDESYYYEDHDLEAITDPVEYINTIETKYPDCTLCIKGAKEYFDMYDYYKCYTSAAFSAGRSLGEELDGGTSTFTEIYSNTATEAETISGVHNGITVTESLTYDEVYLALEDFPEYTYFKAGLQLGYGISNLPWYHYSYYGFYGDWAAKIEE